MMISSVGLVLEIVINTKCERGGKKCVFIIWFYSLAARPRSLGTIVSEKKKLGVCAVAPNTYLRYSLVNHLENGVGE